MFEIEKHHMYNLWHSSNGIKTFSPQTAIHIFSEDSTHGAHWKGRDLGYLLTASQIQVVIFNP